MHVIHPILKRSILDEVGIEVVGLVAPSSLAAKHLPLLLLALSLHPPQVHCVRRLLVDWSSGLSCRCLAVDNGDSLALVLRQGVLRRSGHGLHGHVVAKLVGVDGVEYPDLRHVLDVQLGGEALHDSAVPHVDGDSGRRFAVVLDATRVPVVENGPGGGVCVGQTALLELARGPGDEGQEAHAVLEPRDPVQLHEVGRRTPVEDRLHGGQHVAETLHMHAVPEGYRGRVAIGEDDARGVDQPDVLVEHHLLRDLGEAGHRRHANGSRTEERVDQGALPD